MSSTTQNGEQKPTETISEPKPETTTNTKPAEPSTAEKAAEKNDEAPRLKRTETMYSTRTDDSEFFQREASRSFQTYDEFVQPPRAPRAGRRIAPPPRRFNYSPSPQRMRTQPILNTLILYSSRQLLDLVDYDGIIDMPFPAKSSIYLTTFPFSGRDVAEWSWLFKLGVEGKLVHKRVDARDRESDTEDEWPTADRRGRAHRPINVYRHDRSPVYIHDNTVDIPSVYLSRALDPAVIPESSEKDFTYLIVVRNRARGGSGAKLLTAGNRKAAGIIVYYEALIGNSVVFVGAVKEGKAKKKSSWKYKYAENVNEAVKAAEEGVRGVIC